MWVASYFAPMNDNLHRLNTWLGKPRHYSVQFLQDNIYCPCPIQTLDRSACSQSQYSLQCPCPYCAVVFTEWDMIKRVELSQIWYLRPLFGLRVLDCQRNCNILNWLKIETIVIGKPTDYLIRLAAKNVYDNFL
jgi:hypothetical protein